MIDVFKRFRKHEKNRIITSNGNNFSYSGKITPEIIDSILMFLELKFRKEWSNSTKKNKFMAVMIEVIQNVYHHMAVIDSENLKEYDTNSAIIIIGRNDLDVYSIYSGNFMLLKNTKIMKLKIDEINAMNDDERKIYYREKLNSTELSEKGGAGLGIIEIVRKSKNCIDYNIENISKKFSFISLGIKI